MRNKIIRIHYQHIQANDHKVIEVRPANHELSASLQSAFKVRKSLGDVNNTLRQNGWTWGSMPYHATGNGHLWTWEKAS